MPEGAPASEWIICVDESGDLGLRNFNSKFPIFLVAMVIFPRTEFTEVIVPAFENLKREFFGSPDVPLHEIDSRRGFGPIRTLRTEQRRDDLRMAIRNELSSMGGRIVAAAVDKRKFASIHQPSRNLYDQCFLACAVPLWSFLPGLADADPLTELVVESRGKTEDHALSETVNALSRGRAEIDLQIPFDLRFVGKADHHIGVEIADLVANPIAREVLGLPQPSLPFSAIRSKFLGPDSGGDPVSLMRVSPR